MWETRAGQTQSHVRQEDGTVPWLRGSHPSLAVSSSDASSGPQGCPGHLCVGPVHRDRAGDTAEIWAGPPPSALREKRAFCRGNRTPRASSAPRPAQCRAASGQGRDGPEEDPGMGGAPHGPTVLSPRQRRAWLQWKWAPSVLGYLIGENGNTARDGAGQSWALTQARCTDKF